jgi:DNA polymerase III alpha subunit (gram-positive type)
MDANFIILDCETGGLRCKENPITEVALIVVDPISFATIHSYQTFVKPYNDLKITVDALKASRVTMSQINAGVEHKVLLTNLIKIFAKYKQPTKATSKPILIGHNFGFDIDFLEYLFDFLGYSLWDYVDRFYYYTIKLAREYER